MRMLGFVPQPNLHVLCFIPPTYLEDFETGQFRSFQGFETTVVERLGGHPEHFLQMALS
jgi:hypothetical protein